MSDAPRPEPSRFATYDDLLPLPEHERAEIFDGTVVVQPSSSYARGCIRGCLFVALSSAFQLGRGGPGGWWISQDIDVRLAPHDIVRPDVVGWRRGRLASLDKLPIDGVPDWICEIVSPVRQRRELDRKRRLYARHGVTHFWVIQQSGSVFAYVLKQGEWVWSGVYEIGDVVRIPPFDAIELQLADIFPPPRAS